jgi:hypothetical protein
MRANEFIVEGEFRKSVKRALKGMQEFEHTDNSPYMSYRLGVAFAVAPQQHMDQTGPIPGQRITTMAYTDAEQAIVDAAAKLMGFTPQQITDDSSDEADFVNTKSPMNPQGPIKRKKS